MSIEPTDPANGPRFPDQPQGLFGWRQLHKAEIFVALRFVFWIGIPLFFLLTVYERRLLGQQRISETTFWLLSVLNVPIVLGVVWLVVRTLDGTSHLLVGMVSGEAGAPVATPGFSREETLVMQGRIDEAVAAYRQRAADEPDLIEAKLRLADLLAGKGNDPMAARALYLELRLDPAARLHEATIADGLLRIYKKTNDQRGLRAELTREARLFAGTPRGDGALRVLQELPPAHPSGDGAEDRPLST